MKAINKKIGSAVSVILVALAGYSTPLTIFLWAWMAALCLFSAIELSGERPFLSAMNFVLAGVFIGYGLMEAIKRHHRDAAEKQCIANINRKFLESAEATISAAIENVRASHPDMNIEIERHEAGNVLAVSPKPKIH